MIIKNVEQLRNMVIEAMENLVNGKMDVHDAATLAKGSETIMSSLKLQLSYANMIGEKPYIPFIHDCHVQHTASDDEEIETLDGELIRQKRIA